MGRVGDRDRTPKVGGASARGPSSGGGTVVGRAVYRLYATRASCCAIARFTADYSVRVHGNGPEEKEDRESAE